MVFRSTCVTKNDFLMIGDDPPREYKPAVKKATFTSSMFCLKDCFVALDIVSLKVDFYTKLYIESTCHVGKPDFPIKVFTNSTQTLH